MRELKLRIWIPVAVVPAIALASVVVRADGPRDNIPSAVRPIPPPGIPVPAAERAQLEKGISELGREMARLRSEPRTAALVPDVEIFRTAVETALREGEILAAGDIERAKDLVAMGLGRARLAAKGQSPWLTQPGPTALGYASALDGSVQPYGVYIPATWNEKAPQRWRLDTWFHGRGETLTEVNFIAGVLKSGGPFVRPDAFVIQPYGRYCNGSRFAGEVDFFEALADLERRFRIDGDRIVVRGFSLGGATTWHMAAHHSSRWAAAAPGAGFSETADFLKVFQSETLAPARWEVKLWQLYDSPAYAENFRNLPTVAYSGEIDRQKQAADVMVKALAGVGIDLVHVIGPQTAHKYHPDAIVTINRLVDGLALRGRDPLPRRVTLTTPTLKYDTQAWVTVDGLGRHWEKALIDAELVAGIDSAVRLDTKNVTALTLAMTPGLCPFFPGRAVTVTIDRQKLAGPVPSSDRSWTARFRKVGNKWQAGPAPEDGLRKRHDLQGPIDDAFMAPFLVVTPSQPPMHPAISGWVAAEQARAIKEWRRHFRGAPRVKRDADVTSEDIAAYNLALWGDPGSNAILGRIATKLPIRWSPDGIFVAKEQYAPDKHALIAVYPNPLHPARYVVLNSGFTYREYDYLNNARETPKLPDWAVVDVTTPPDSRLPGKIANADFFGEHWELLH